MTLSAYPCVFKFNNVTKNGPAGRSEGGHRCRRRAQDHPLRNDRQAHRLIPVPASSRSRPRLGQALIDTMFELPNQASVEKVVVDESVIDDNKPPLLVYRESAKQA